MSGARLAGVARNDAVLEMLAPSLYLDAAARSTCTIICIGDVLGDSDVAERCSRATTVEQSAAITIRAVSADRAVDDSPADRIRCRSPHTFSTRTLSMIIGQRAVANRQVTNVVDAAAHIRYPIGNRQVRDADIAVDDSKTWY